MEWSGVEWSGVEWSKKLNHCIILASLAASLTSSNASLFVPNHSKLLVSGFEATFAGFTKHARGEEGKKKYAAQDTLLRTLAHVIIHGDSEFYYEIVVTPLLRMVFDILDVYDSSTEDTEENEKVKAEAEVEVEVEEVELEVEEEDKGEEEEVEEESNTKNDKDIFNMARSTLSFIARRCLIKVDNATQIVDNLIELVRSVIEGEGGKASWQVRQAAIRFLGQFYATHLFLISPDQTEQIRALVVGLMGDKRREVSVSATSSFTVLLAAMSEEQCAKIVEEFAALAQKALRRKGKMLIAQARACNVLVASVLIRPYDVPKFVPVALGALAPHSFEKNAPPLVRQSVTKCISEFRRTHADNWAEHRLKFEISQLETLDDSVSLTSNYYA